jgi:transcriptional regulator with XRE-family HTH domain
MNNRIGLLLKVKDVTASKFAEMIGVQPSNISHILSGRNKPSLDFITKVCDTFPDISIDWLMFGRGSMFQHQPEQMVSPQTNIEKEKAPDHQQIQTKSAIPDLFSQVYPSENESEVTQTDPDAEYDDHETETEQTNEESGTAEEKQFADENESEEEKVILNVKDDIKEDNTVEKKMRTPENDCQEEMISLKPVRIILIYQDETFEIIETRKSR